MAIKIVHIQSVQYDALIYEYIVKWLPKYILRCGRAKGTKKLPQASLIRALIPFRRALPP
jgi:hypothetical protein